MEGCYWVQKNETWHTLTKIAVFYILACFVKFRFSTWGTVLRNISLKLNDVRWNFLLGRSWIEKLSTSHTNLLSSYQIYRNYPSPLHWRANQNKNRTVPLTKRAKTCSKISAAQLRNVENSAQGAVSRSPVTLKRAVVTLASITSGPAILPDRIARQKKAFVAYLCLPAVDGWSRICLKSGLNCALSSPVVKVGSVNRLRSDKPYSTATLNY